VLGLLPLLLASCGACHAEQQAAWERSRHATASTNAVYRASHALEPMQWCDSCHLKEGITCETCHVQDGVVLSARATTAKGQQAHAMREAPQLNQSDFCGSCHQFNFPLSRAEPVRFSKHPMQNTLAEWRATQSAQTCQDCHEAHNPPGPHDVKSLRAALRATATRVGDEVRIALTPAAVGHRFPTGDPFRRLRLELCRDEACTAVVAARELERQVRATHDGWEIAQDLTLPPEGLTVAVHAAQARFVRLSYRYAARSSEAQLEEAEREAVLFTQSIGDAP
jgi:hypothetical protein